MKNKKKLLIILIIIAIVFYLFAVQFDTNKTTDSFIILLCASIFLAISTNLFKNYNKKKNKIEFKVDKVKVKKSDK